MSNGLAKINKNILLENQISCNPGETWSRAPIINCGDLKTAESARTTGNMQEESRCGKCQDFIDEGMVFNRGGNSSLRRWLVSFCRRIKI